MDLLVRGQNLNLSEANRDYALKKIQHTERFFADKSARSKITVKRIPKGFNVEIAIKAKGMELRASNSDESFYAAVDRVIDKLEKQIRKHKTKTLKRKQRTEPILKDKSNDTLQDTIISQHFIKDTKIDEGILQTEQGNQQTVVIQDKEFLKPMTLEEATLQFSRNNQDFFVYKCEDNNINVLYRRFDGSLGLIRTI